MSKILSISLIILAFIIGLGITFAFLFGEGGVVNKSAKYRANDSSIMLSVGRARTIMRETFYEGEENYDSFDCQHTEAKNLCDDVSAAGSKMIIVKV